jgi:putative oxidoreductase
MSGGAGRECKEDDMAIGLLLIRLVFGGLMAAHGSQKLFGWFGGYGLTGTGTFFDQLGFRPGRLFAAAASVSEVLGGVLVALGFGGPIGPALIVSVMLVAGVSVHWGHGLFATTNGIEVPLLYAAGAAALAFTGPGRYSLDALFGLTALSTTADAGIALGLAALAAIASLAARQSAVPSSAHA